MKKIADTTKRREVLYLLYDTAEKISKVLTDEQEKKRFSTLMAVCFNAANEDTKDEAYIIPKRQMNGFVEQWTENNGLYTFSKI